eukprot:TRINITY_DN17808_c0_g1_i2.p1 TRINITY_DN17808_c0_g1~~TRINITY_DN17808_c0_g1_i2.p1  ORF type:complete len:129 (+),score=17.96 TRINITY_DN17808_c0_g1_i2:71-457(+)
MGAKVNKPVTQNQVIERPVTEIDKANAGKRVNNFVSGELTKEVTTSKARPSREGPSITVSVLHFNNEPEVEPIGGRLIQSGLLRLPPETIRASEAEAQYSTRGNSPRDHTIIKQEERLPGLVVEELVS